MKDILHLAMNWTRHPSISSGHIILVLQPASICLIFISSLVSTSLLMTLLFPICERCMCLLMCVWAHICMQIHVCLHCVYVLVEANGYGLILGNSVYFLWDRISCPVATQLHGIGCSVSSRDPAQCWNYKCMMQHPHLALHWGAGDWTQVFIL